MKKILSSLLAVFILAASLALAACTDTDGGENYPVEGTVAGLDISKNQVVSYTDTCSSTGWISEYYCNVVPQYPDGYIVSSHRSCLKCEGGACPDTCTDSDGGKDYYKKGSVTIEAKDKSKKEVYEDKCKEHSCDRLDPIASMYCQSREATEKVAVLEEMYCNDKGYQATERKLCENGCAGDGACLSTVAGEDVAELKEDVSTLKSDVAILKSKVAELEQKCSQITTPTQPEVPSEPTNAPVVIGSCTDSDGGIKAAVKGTTKGLVLAAKKVMAFNDECANKNQVREYFCDTSKKNEGYVNYKVEKCSGQCQEGKCVTGTPTGSLVKMQGKSVWQEYKKWAIAKLKF